jgi:GMP synthase-like glutamine amidotransferase
MILVVSMCADRLSELEFVRPIEDILRKENYEFVTKHYSEVRAQELDNISKVILCGTALKDFEYLRDLESFRWLRKYERSVLGICAGTQVICSIFGSRLIEHTLIGRYSVKILKENELISKDFHAYFLVTRVPVVEEFIVLGEAESIPCFLKHKDKAFYGCLFHSEVLNPEIIVKFIRNL